MGKENKKRPYHHHVGQKKKKRRKEGGYWINTCHESKPKKGEALMTILITQSNLVDDHTAVGQGNESKPKASDTPEKTNIEESRDTEEGMALKSSTDGVPKGTATEEDEPGSTGGTKGDDDAANESMSVTEKNPLKREAGNDETISSEPSDHASTQAHSTTQETKEDDPTESKDFSRAFISVKRMPSVSKPRKVYDDKNFQHLPNGDCGDGIVNPYPTDQVADKYWAQRHRLFTRYDDGIELDNEGWFSVTPEAIANHIAKRVVEASSGDGVVVLDAFCGCGGNAIAFARRPEVSLVLCVDTDLKRLEMAAKNASIYNIENKKLLFVHDNAIHVLSHYNDGKLVAMPSATAKSAENGSANLHGYSCDGRLPERLDCVFLSPPWGGTEYLGKGQFNVKMHILLKDADDTSVNGEELLAMTAKAAKQCVYFLPRNLNGVRFGRSALQAGYTRSVELEKNVLNDKFKTLTCYLGFDSETTNANETAPKVNQSQMAS